MNANGMDAIKRISSTYEVRGMVETLTSFDNATPGSGTALNQFKLTYNAFSQLTVEAQDHNGTASGSTPVVGYAYASGGSSSNQIRPTSLTYPDSRQIAYGERKGRGTVSESRIHSDLPRLPGIMVTHVHPSLHSPTTSLRHAA